jgi:hypothetical protein
MVALPAAVMAAVTIKPEKRLPMTISFCLARRLYRFLRGTGTGRQAVGSRSDRRDPESCGHGTVSINLTLLTLTGPRGSFRLVPENLTTLADFSVSLATRALASGAGRLSHVAIHFPFFFVRRALATSRD